MKIQLLFVISISQITITIYYILKLPRKSSLTTNNVPGKVVATATNVGGKVVAPATTVVKKVITVTTVFTKVIATETIVTINCCNYSFTDVWN